MPVRLMCPNLKCRKILLVPDDCREKVVKCQHCQMTLKVPAAKALPALVPGARAVK